MKRFGLTARTTEVLEPTLVWQRPDATSLDVYVPLGRAVTIGRAPDNTLIIDSPRVSANHAAVRVVGGRCVIEDLKSDKGTRVNGQPVVTHVLTPGDVIDVGDQVITFVDRAAGRRRARRLPRAGAQGAVKLVRLGLAAAMTSATLVPILWLRVVEPHRAIIAPPSAPAMPAPVPAARVRALAGFVTGRSARVDEVAGGAARAGISAADALYDDGQAQARAGRFFEAAQLHAAALRANPEHPTAQQRQDEALTDLERSVTTWLAAADRQSEDLQWDAAAASWASVIDALPPDDPRVARARAAIETARPRLSRSAAAATSN